MTISSNSGLQENQHDHDHDYASLLASVRSSFTNNTADTPPLFFTQDAANLFDLFLAHIPANERQVHTCNTCRSFFKRYAGLVRLVDGQPKSVLFNDSRTKSVPFYAAAVNAVRNEVERRAIAGVFYTEEPRWGTSETQGGYYGYGGADRTWTHMSVTPARKYVHSSVVRTAGQERAERRHEFETLRRALGEFKIEHLETAEFLLNQNTLYRSEQILGRVTWLKDLKQRYESAARGRRDLLLWEAVATAPAGFAKPRAGVIGQLLEDIESGMKFDQIKRRFDASMDPTKYQRPQNAPSEGNIKQAEKIVARLGSAGSLRRRFARIEDLQLIWSPLSRSQSPDTVEAAVFDHLRKAPQASSLGNIKGPDMSFTQFREQVLPKAEGLELYIPSGTLIALGAYVTAADMDAPPIIQWDTEEQRNPVTWYVYDKGSNPINFGINTGWQKLTGISLQPNQWWPSEATKHHGEGALLIIEGAVDKRNKQSALFPEFLHSDYHSIRRTIEHHSKAFPLEGEDQASACGLRISKSANFGDLKVRATIEGRTVTYSLTHW